MRPRLLRLDPKLRQDERRRLCRRVRGGFLPGSNRRSVAASCALDLLVGLRWSRNRSVNVPSATFSASTALASPAPPPPRRDVLTHSCRSSTSVERCCWLCSSSKRVESRLGGGLLPPGLPHPCARRWRKPGSHPPAGLSRGDAVPLVPAVVPVGSAATDPPPPPPPPPPSRLFELVVSEKMFRADEILMFRPRFRSCRPMSSRSAVSRRGSLPPPPPPRVSRSAAHIGAPAGGGRMSAAPRLPCALDGAVVAMPTRPPAPIPRAALLAKRPLAPGRGSDPPPASWSRAVPSGA
jgi:hypothetical protein